MASPFPGMDPYLEDPEIFPDLHGGMIAQLKRALQPLLPATYYARVNRRAWIEVSERPIEPDVGVYLQARSQHASTTTVLNSPTTVGPVLIAAQRTIDEDFKQSYLEIFSGKGVDKRLVTSVELLSPSNKRRGSDSRVLYLQKQRELLGSEVNFIEIDLLRGGSHSTAVSLEETRKKCGAFDYHVCVRRLDDPAQFRVYAFSLADRLPEIAVPLLPPSADVTIDLQRVFEEAYADSEYEREIDYGRSPIVPPLTAAQQEWAKGIVEASKLQTPKS